MRPAFPDAAPGTSAAFSRRTSSKARRRLPMSVRWFVALVAALPALAMATAGCSQKPSPSSPPSTQASAPTSTRPVSPSVAAGEDLVRLCKLSLGGSERAPKFDFDRSDLSTEDRDVLLQIAKCITTGPL